MCHILLRIVDGLFDAIEGHSCAFVFVQVASLSTAQIQHCEAQLTVLGYECALDPVIEVEAHD